MTREILAVAEYEVEMEADYIAGLLHNLGIAILAITFPEEFDQVYTQKRNNHLALTKEQVSLVESCKLELTIFGIIIYPKISWKL